MKKKLRYEQESIIDSNLNINSMEDEWEDPLVLKKQGIAFFKKKDISYYKKKIIDEKYLDNAINRIAMELSHFILKNR